MTAKLYKLVPVEYNPFLKGEIERIVPIAESQLEIWLASVIGGDDGSRCYNESISLRLQGHLNREILEKAVQSVVNRHEALRCTFSKEGERVYIYHTKEVCVKYEDISPFSSTAQTNWLADFRKEDANHAFDLKEGPLIRFLLIKLNEEEHVLWITAHHIICDGWSYGVILEEISSFYTDIIQGRNPALQHPFPISAYSLEMEDFKKTETYQNITNYWLNKLTPIPDPLDLPIDFARTNRRVLNTNRHDVPLNSDLAIAIKRLGSTHGISFVNTLLIAFEVFLNRITGQSTVIVGLPTAGQLATDHFTLVGHCVNFLPLKGEVNTGLSFVDHLQLRIRQLLDDYDNQLVSYGALVKAFKIKRDNSRAPFIGAVFNVDIGTDVNVNFYGIQHQLISNPRAFGNFELFLNVAQRGDFFVLEWAYHTSLFNANTIEWMNSAFTMLLEKITALPQVRINEIVLPPRNIDTQENKDNGTHPALIPSPEHVHHIDDFPLTRTLLDDFIDQAKKTPDNVAIVFEGIKTTYKSLDEKSTQLAQYLSINGISAKSPVPLCIQPCPEMIIGLLAIWKAGAAYVPIDPELPLSRIQHIIEESKSPLIISDQVISAKLTGIIGVNCLIVDDLGSGIWSPPLSDQASLPELSSQAYIIYTSGSTGNPKGVCITHRALADYFAGIRKHLPALNGCTDYSFGNTVATDLGNTILYQALTTGGTLHLFTKERFNDPSFIGQYFQEHEIDCMKIVPSHWKYLSESVGGLFPKKLLIFGGEALPNKLIKDINAADAPCTVVNHYGPTETTIGKLFHVVDSSKKYPAIIPIGKPFSNTSVFVFDENLSQCSSGVAGELYIGGEGLATGYFKNQELTEHVFIPNPIVDHPHRRLYKTGDLVRQLPNGDVEYISRVDDQVKIRGNRVELGEIQNTVLSLEGIRHCAVVVDNDSNDEKRLITYVVVTDKILFDKADAIRALCDRLPDYMVPKIWMVIDRLPLNANGKLDKKALPKVDRNIAQSEYKFVAPRTETEVLLVPIWQNSLKHEKISILDNFFELGGHSLIAIKVMLEIERATGERLPMASLFEHPTIEQLAELIDGREITSSTAKSDSSDSADKTSPTAKTITVPITEPQKEVWLSCMIGGNEASLAYNQSFTAKLEGAFDKSVFSRTINHIVARHEALRATVSENGEQLIIQASCSTSIVYEDFVPLNNNSEKDSRFKDDIQQALATPFDLNAGPLFKVFIHKYRSDLHYFTLIIHHIICDATSMGVLISDINTYYNAFYDGKKPTLPAPSQLSEYALNQFEFAQSTQYKAVEKFWLDQYQDKIPHFNLPTDYARPNERTYEGDYRNFELDTRVYSSLKRISTNNEMSMAAAITGLTEIFLHHRTGEEDITLGITSAGQYLSDRTDMIGHCVNLLPLRSQLSPNQTLYDYLLTRKKYIYDVYDHQQLTFGELLRKLNIRRDQGRVPLVPFVLTIRVGGTEGVEFNGITSELISNPRASHTFEILLNVTINHESQTVSCYWAYNARLFKGETIKRMMEELKLIIQTTSETPQVAVKESLPIANPFPEYTDYECDYPTDITVLDLFANKVKRHPTNVAIQFSHRNLTYQALDEKSTQLANYLISFAPNSALIPIFIQPSPEMIIGILGILKSGKAYVPIDPEFPQQRVSHILGECASPIVISDKETAKLLNNIEADLPAICLLDDPDESWQAVDNSTFVDQLPKPENSAYVIYTSGSTGVPKGVVIAHKSLTDYFFGIQQHIPVWDDCKSYALGSSIATDLGNTVLFGALISGATLHVFHKEQFNNDTYIKDYFDRHSIDCLKIVPSHWKYLSEACGGLFPNKLLIFGGELLPGHFIQTIANQASDCTIVNHYGPTETTIGKLLHVVDKNRDYGISVPIGRPFSNTTALVLNAGLKFCPVGVPGELYIGGDGLATGYHNNPTLTSGVFIPNPVKTSKHLVVYKTGDLVRWNETGEIEYLGRKDDQVKIRGHRVELDEITRVITDLLGIVQCAVVAEKQEDETNKLRAFVITTREFELRKAIEILKTKIPDYMIPRTWSEIEEIPRLPNGKIDKRTLIALPHQSIQGLDESAVSLPETDVQKRLSAIWKDLLKLNSIDIGRDFFEMGGHSLIAVKMMAIIEKEFGTRLPLASLFKYPTIKQLSELLEDSHVTTNWESLVPIKSTGNKPPLYLVHGIGLNVLFFQETVRHLDSDQPIFALQAKGLDGSPRPDQTVEEIAADYNREILKHNPTGPYALSGYSYGGVLAVEMAKQLKAMGKDVSFVGLFDTYANTSTKELLGGNNWSVIKFQLNKTLAVPLIFAKYPYHYIKDKYFYAKAHLRHFVRWLLPNNTLFNEPPKYFRRLRDQHMDALKKYSLTSYDGDVTLFRSKEKIIYMPFLDTNGWRPSISGDIHIVEIPGNHAQLFQEPIVGVLGKELQKRLDEIHLLKSQSKAILNEQTA